MSGYLGSLRGKSTLMQNQLGSYVFFLCLNSFGTKLTANKSVRGNLEFNMDSDSGKTLKDLKILSFNGRILEKDNFD